MTSVESFSKMTTVLITSFDKYGRWEANASWLTLVEFVKQLPNQPAVTTRRYPVDFEKTPDLLRADLEKNYDVAIHLGQAPGSTCVVLERFALNIGAPPEQGGDSLRPLVSGGPAAYETSLPLADWAGRLRTAGIPAKVSCHAGTYLCNAVFYHGMHWAAQLGLATRSVFVHVPLVLSQTVTQNGTPPAGWPIATTVEALRILVEAAGEMENV